MNGITVGSWTGIWTCLSPILVQRWLLYHTSDQAWMDLCPRFYWQYLSVHYWPSKYHLPCVTRMDFWGNFEGIGITGSCCVCHSCCPQGGFDDVPVSNFICRGKGRETQVHTCLRCQNMNYDVELESSLLRVFHSCLLGIRTLWRKMSQPNKYPESPALVLIYMPCNPNPRLPLLQQMT